MINTSAVRAQYNKRNVFFYFGVADGEQLFLSANVGVDFQYNFMPWLGIIARLDTYHSLSRIKNMRNMSVIDGKFEQTMTGKRITTFNKGSLVFYGVGIAFNPLGFVEKLSRHTLSLADGGGWAHAYAVSAQDADYALKFYNSGGLAWFTTIRYKYLVTEHLSLGPYVGIMGANMMQFNGGLTLCAEF